MKDRNNNDIKTLLKSLEGKNVFLITKSGLHYRTKNLLLISDDSIQFSDKFNYKVLLSIDQIAQISEVAR